MSGNKSLLRIIASIALVSSLWIVVTEAFTPVAITPKVMTIKTSDTVLYDVQTVFDDDGSGVSYSERSRPYRRDVFAYDDWVKHRSSARFTGRLAKLTQSGVVRSLSKELALITAVASFIAIFNALAGGGYDDFSGIHHDPLISIFPVLQLPATFFTLSSPALSLLLGTYIFILFLFFAVVHGN